MHTLNFIIWKQELQDVFLSCSLKHTQVWFCIQLWKFIVYSILLFMFLLPLLFFQFVTQSQVLIRIYLKYYELIIFNRLSDQGDFMTPGYSGNFSPKSFIYCTLYEGYMYIQSLISQTFTFHVFFKWDSKHLLVLKICIISLNFKDSLGQRSIETNNVLHVWHWF